MSEILAELEIDILKAGIAQLEADKARLLSDIQQLQAILYKVMWAGDRFSEVETVEEIKAYVKERLEAFNESKRDIMLGTAAASDRAT